MVGTPHPLHAEPVIQAAEAGVHALVEKPLAASLADCDAMLAAARRAGTRLGVISQRRLYEPVRRMKEAIEAGKIGTPALGTFIMLSWRDRAYYESDAWRGRWDTEGGGVLVNQSPHMLDLLQWFMGDIDEITGTWANLNHPYIEVEDTALAMIRFKNGGLGSIVTSLAQRPGIYTKVHIHGSNGASVGVETDRGATFVAGVSEIAEPPLNDLWTIPGEEHLPGRVPGRGPRPLPPDQPHDALSRPANPGLLASDSGQSAAAGDRGGRADGGGDVHGHLPLATGAAADQVSADGRRLGSPYIFIGIAQSATVCCGPQQTMESPRERARRVRSCLRRFAGRVEG